MDPNTQPTGQPPQTNPSPAPQQPQPSSQTPAPQQMNTDKNTVKLPVPTSAVPAILIGFLVVLLLLAITVYAFLG